jgi:hypothetical protein
MSPSGDPNRCINLSHLMHELKRTAEGRHTLLRVIYRFPNNGLVRYNPPATSVSFGQLQKSREWLRKPFAFDRVGS